MADLDEYRIELAAQPESLAIIRLFVATVLRSRGAGEGTVEDAKLAISELATVSIQTGARRMSVTMHSNGTSVDVALRPCTAQPSDDAVGGEDVSPNPVDIAAALFATLTIERESNEARFSIELADS